MDKTFSRRGFLATSAAVTGAALSAGRTRAAVRPPNVVYIVCDQMRGDALGLLGNPNAHTPHLDKLAAEGVCFERWFSNNPVCAPSRATVFTGLYPHQHGKTTNKDGAPPDRLDGTLLGHLAERGYRLGWVGKNHTYAEHVLRGLDYYRPRNREPFRKYPPNVPPWWHSDMYWPTDGCHAELNTRDAVQFIEDSRDAQPFFLHVSYFDPHPPYFAPAEAVEMFGKVDMALPPEVPASRLSQRLADYARAMQFEKMSEADLRQTMRYYHASIAWGVDQQVGAVIEALERKGLLENTIVVFSADHGDFMGHHHMVRKGMFHYDDLLHVPMIWYAPALIEGGRRIQAQGAHIDLFPTLAELSGGAVPDLCEGVSHAAVLRDGEAAVDRPVYASATYSDLPAGYFDDPEPLYEAGREGGLHEHVMSLTTSGNLRTAMIRTRNWKLIRNETGGNELYALDGTLGEVENVFNAPEHAQVHDELLRQVEAFWPWT